MNALGFLRRYLQAKVLSLIVAILIVGFGLLGAWNIQYQSAALLKQSKEASSGSCQRHYPEHRERHAGGAPGYRPGAQP
jgi:hypothetical protein